VLFLRLDASVGASPHIDQRRAKALNIGFQNSNTCTTYVREGKDLEGFFDDFGKLQAFTMNDGDAYLLDVGQAHAVRSNVPEAKDLKRYIISHNLAKHNQ
jgi:beta-galactosidase beta subunit